MMKRIPFSLLLLLAIICAGCGVYTFNPKGKSEIQNIAIEPFENRTGEFGLADRITEIVIDAFIVDGTMRIVPTANADAYLVGVLTRYERVPHKFDENDQVEQYKVLMNFEIALKNPKDDSEKWTQTMVQEGIYDANEETEEDGQQRAGERLVEAIINKTTKSW